MQPFLASDGDGLRHLLREGLLVVALGLLDSSLRSCSGLGIAGSVLNQLDLCLGCIDRIKSPLYENAKKWSGPNPSHYVSIVEIYFT